MDLAFLQQCYNEDPKQLINAYLFSFTDKIETSEPLLDAEKLKMVRKLPVKKPQPICFGLFMVHKDTRKVWLKQPGVKND